MMWKGGWEQGRHAKERMRETSVRNSLCRATVEHGLRQLAAARGEKSEIPSGEMQRDES
jgi:hypothetical protein